MKSLQKYPKSVFGNIPAARNGWQLFLFSLVLLFSVPQFSCESAEEPVSGTGEEVALAEPRDCPSDHPNVGKVAELATRQHDVSGSVEILDNCTLGFSSFTYDGGGAADGVYVYLAEGAAYTSGTQVSKDIKGITYSGQDFELPLPESVSLDDFDSISIWCEQFAISFGDGSFE
jgi:hypothetical protein